MISKEDILKAHILIVDDIQADVILLKDILHEAGYKNINTTITPSTVSDLHHANGYDLILLDMQMSDMNGFEVMAELKSNLCDDYLPIFAITTQPEDKLRATAAGAKDIITRPFDISEINPRIQNQLEVRLLYKKLENYNQVLELTVQQRTAELSASEARYRCLIELASDWYWEQDEHGSFTIVSGPVREMLGIQTDPGDDSRPEVEQPTWNESEREELRDKIDSRQPFLDFVFSCVNPDGREQKFQVSGEPMFNQSARFIGYRGIGVELIVSNNMSEQGK
ncbi:response regulator [Marinomonas sp. RSW2]|uniref:Response regulator n=1 Tax=Marinomonas maritima TaxID=2940935 RepID=A0ABT5WDZ5_9GAMM|nr:response regulator [Marinomonas maritima]MDE8603042.1 response regulator [Marinomonas maritima]